MTGEILLIRDLIQNISSTITEGIDYEAIYTFDTSIFGGSGFGTFTFTLNGNYLSRYVAAINIGDKPLEYAGDETAFAGYLPHHRIYGSIFYDRGGLDTGVTVHFVSQGNDLADNTFNGQPRKIREWTTVDAILSYSFKLATPVAENEVAGYAKAGGSKEVMPVSTAEYSPCGLRAWLNGTTITLGMQNIFDLDPPFAAGGFENGHEEATFNIKGRFWYVAVKKRF